MNAANGRVPWDFLPARGLARLTGKQANFCVGRRE